MKHSMLIAFALVTVTLAGCNAQNRRMGTPADWDRIDNDQEQTEEHARAGETET